MAERGFGRRLGWLVGIVFILALLWLGYWYAANMFAERTIARFNGVPHNGQTVECTEPALSGFPLRLDFRCSKGTYSGPLERVTAALGGVAASAPLYWPGSVEATLDSPLVLNAPAHGIALSMTWSEGTATGSAGLNGLRSVGAAFTALSANNTGTVPGLPVKSLAADAASASISPAGGGAYTILASTRGMKLTRTDDSALPNIDADIGVTALNVGSGLGTDPVRSLIEWLRAGSSIRIDRLRIAAGGAILGANGTLSISNEGVLSGSVVLRFTNLEAFTALADQIKPGSGEHASQAMAAITALSVPVDTEDGPARQTTVSITDGLVWVGIIPVGAAPRIKL
ncbi:MAG TPA: DUF2125 domain-containing protein [Bauldia sp.]